MVNLSVNGTTIEDIELAIFDKDGTLIDLYYYWGNMIVLRANLIGEQLGLNDDDLEKLIYEMGVDRKLGRLRPEGPVGVKKREIVMQAAVNFLKEREYGDHTLLCFESFKQVDEISAQNLNSFIRPIDGAIDFLKQLNTKACRIAIATTDKADRAKLACEFLKISELIDVIFGADMVIHTKPDPEMIYKILGHLKVESKNAVMIGDAVTDILMGKNAKLRASIGVLSGIDLHETLNKITEYIVNDVSMIKVD